MKQGDGKSITGKVFDTDSNPVQARLLISGPTDVDGEPCLLVEPTDFFGTAPSPHYEGQDRPTLAADDLRIAVPVRYVDEDSARCRQALQNMRDWLDDPESEGDAVDVMGAELQEAGFDTAGV